MTLKDLRDDIDRIDMRLLDLLNTRMEKTILTKVFKSSIQDGEREEAVLERIKKSSRCLAKPEFTTSIWASVIGESKKLQEMALETVGFQGEHGANSEVAARHWNSKVAAIPCKEFPDVFEAVQEGVLDYGIVPVENSLGGLVGPVNSILIYSDLKIIAAIDMPISHCLLALPGVDHREIRSAYSHVQALAQCRHFLLRNKLEPRSHYDTAGAARMIAEERIRDAAAIANRFAAEIYDLEIIKDDIQDAKINRTRFFVIARKDIAQDGDKCSAVFTAGDKAGALFETLEAFAKAGINLTRIESVPDTPGVYAIFIDFEGSLKDTRIKNVISRAGELAKDFRVLGCYKEAKL